MKLDLDPNRPIVPPREAATLILVRERAPNATDTKATLEVFCVVRHTKSGFLGGAVVFPGGKVDAADRDPAWTANTTTARLFGQDDDANSARAYAVAVCREALEEAAILLTSGEPVPSADVLALRDLVTKDAAVSFRDALVAKGLTLDLAALTPFGRWVTPVAESRRFDTRFFLAAAPAGQEGAPDAHETTASFWASPREVLRRFEARELELAPPTHRALELLAKVDTARDAFALAETLGVLPICPALITVPSLPPSDEDTLALVLPGDPLHEVREPRVPGHSRFVLRSGRWLPEEALTTPPLTDLPDTPAPR